MKSLVAIGALIMALSHSALAEPLTVGVEDIDYYPAYASRDGQYVGFARDVFDLFSAAAGQELAFRSFPIKRLFNVYLSGEVDFKFPDNANWAPDLKAGKNVTYSAPVLEYIDGVLVAGGNVGKGSEALKVLGTVRGFTPYEYLDAIKAGKIKINENSNLEGLIKMLATGRIDGAYFNIKVAEAYIRESGMPAGTALFDPDLPHSRSAYHLSTVVHPEVIERFDAFLKNEAAALEALKKKYGLAL